MFCLNKQSKRFIKNSIGFLILFFISFVLYFQVCSYYGSIPLKVGVQWLKAFYEVKEEIALSKESPKLILFAGSTVDFSISAEMIEKELGIPTVNYGTTASLSDYIFHSVKKVVNSGDTIFMPLEYYYYYCEKNSFFDPVTLKDRYVLAFDQEYYENLNNYDKLSITLVGFRDLYKMMDKKNWDFKPITNIPLSLNKNGDEKNTNPDQKPDKLKEVDSPLYFYERFEDKMEQGYCAMQVSSFIDWAKKNEVRLIAAYPTIYDHQGAYKKGRYPEIFRLIEKFYEDRDIPVLGSPYDAMYPYEDFFNTGYHLHSKARVNHTTKVIELLKDYFDASLIK